MAQAQPLTRGVPAFARAKSLAKRNAGASGSRSSSCSKQSLRSSVATHAFFGKKDDAETARIAALVDTKIDENPVIVWSKSYCPFCVKAKAALDKMDVKYLAIEIDRMTEEKDIQNALETKTGQRTVPNVFVDGKHVGGCDDTVGEIKSGALQKRLTAAGVSFAA
jgi:glutaredoxin 3